MPQRGNALYLSQPAKRDHPEERERRPKERKARQRERRDLREPSAERRRGWHPRGRFVRRQRPGRVRQKPRPCTTTFTENVHPPPDGSVAPASATDDYWK